jgi:hypothetical protein
LTMKHASVSSGAHSGETRRGEDDGARRDTYARAIGLVPKAVLPNPKNRADVIDEHAAHARRQPAADQSERKGDRAIKLASISTHSSHLLAGTGPQKALVAVDRLPRHDTANYNERIKTSPEIAVDL